jgi:hypothetical protein
MDFSLDDGKAMLCRTPAALRELVVGLPAAWTECTDAPGSWSPHQVVGHLTHIEECDWMDRTRRILDDGPGCVLDPVDREAGFARFAGWTTEQLVARFTAVRATNLDDLDELVTREDLGRRGVHPDFGDVTLGQLLATWVVHDLNHLHQIVTTMAAQYREAIGPWRAFLPVVDAT